MKAQANVAQRSDLIVERHIVGKQIEMIARSRASRQQQLRGAHLRTYIYTLGSQPRPDRVQDFQPAEQVAVLGGRYGAGESLIEVMVCVDQTGEHHVSIVQIEDLISSCRQIRCVSDLLDDVIAHEHRRMSQLFAPLVHGHERVDVLDEQRAQGKSRNIMLSLNHRRGW